MHSLTYGISPAIFAAHPAYCRGVVVFRNVDNSRPSGELEALLRTREEKLRGALSGNVAEHPRIAAWRDAFRGFGAKPSEHRSSIEAMVRRIVKPDHLPAINPLVDIGNIVSLKHLLPAGVHPLPERSEDLQLREAIAGDVFVVAGSDKMDRPEEGEFVLASGQDVLTRRWTWRQAAGTQTFRETKHVFFNIDGLPPVTRQEVAAAMLEAEQLVLRYCAGVVVCACILDVENPSLSIAYS